MPDENKGRDAVMLEESAQGTGRKLGQSQTTPKATLDDLSDDEIKEQLKARGLEVRKQRRPKSKIARPDNVDGKRRITVHLSEEVRRALQAASTAVNRTESNIAEEALTEWMDRNNIRSGALGWTLRILSVVSGRGCNSLVHGGRGFLDIGVCDSTLYKN